MRECPDELLADFQQYYGMDLWRLDLSADAPGRHVRRAAILAAQLPPDGRVKRVLDPVGQHSTEAFLLRQIEIDLRSLGGTSDGEAPEPIWLEGEDEEHERAVEREERNAEAMAASFGLRL